MVVGYNHNIRYKGEVFHVQTEDSGINTPHIITLLYRGGNIIASKKTSYADIVKMGNLSQVVEELMKEQHKDMLRRLKSAEFDLKLGLDGIVEAELVSTSVLETGSAVLPEMPVPATQSLPQPAIQQVPSPPPPVTDSPKKKQSLDDLIFDFLSAGDERQ